MDSREANVSVGPRFTVYGLVDPRDGSVRYIGRTSRPLATRLSGHLSSVESRYAGGSKQKRAWLRELLAAGLKPEIRSLETFDKELDALDAEGRCIEKALSEKWPLTNRQRSGKGMISKHGRRERVERAMTARAKAERILRRQQARRPTPLELEFRAGAARKLIATLGKPLGESEINALTIRLIDAGMAAVGDRLGLSSVGEGECPHA